MVRYLQNSEPMLDKKANQWSAIYTEKQRVLLKKSEPMVRYIQKNYECYLKKKEPMVHYIQKNN